MQTTNTLRIIAVGTPYSSTVAPSTWFNQPAYVVHRLVDNRHEGPGRLHAADVTPLVTLLREERRRLTALLPPEGTVTTTRCDECGHEAAAPGPSCGAIGVAGAAPVRIWPPWLSRLTAVDLVGC